MTAEIIDFAAVKHKRLVAEIKRKGRARHKAVASKKQLMLVPPKDVS